MEIIGRNKAAYLSAILPANRTPEQQAQLDEYLKAKQPKEDQQEAKKAWVEKICEPPKKDKQGHRPEELFELFRYHYQKEILKPLIINEDNEYPIKTIIYYFCNDDRFFNSPVLLKEFGGKKLSTSLSKGLLIIGGYGVGKTSVMNTISRCMLPIRHRRFKSYSANQVVESFESCEKASEKTIFWNRMLEWDILFDDVKTERDASNYGKYNLFKDIIERRYQKNHKTYITSNYEISSPDNIDAALIGFGERYGGRVFDRIFEMFNIIEFKGKSLRQ